MPRTRMRLASTATLLAIVTMGCSTPSRGESQRPEFWGFTGPWDTASAISLRANAGLLDAVITGWISLDSVTGRLVNPPLYVDTIRLPAGTATRRMAIVSTSHNARFHPRPIRQLASNPRLLGEVAGAIALEATTKGYRGLVLDFEALEPRDLPAQLAVVEAITDSAHRRGISPVTVAIPAEDTAAYPARAILEVADLVLVMLYDQHWPGSAPGPVAGRDWFRRALAMRLREAGPGRVVAGLPLYGYRWRPGAPTEVVGFRDAERIAAAEGVKLTRDSATGTLRAARPGVWEMWVTDAALLRELVSDARALGVRRFSLWRLGQEDASIWGNLVGPPR